ncbi:MAG TPA: helix-turn-helix transcriptional regulator [Chitinophagaceae bacterium]|nr:helix-turn-helix transcriptional regulator [Chitinophagaceae bacterium]
MNRRRGNYSKKQLPVTTNKFIGTNIQKYRRLYNIKQAVFADSIGISRVSLSNYENNNWRVPIDIWVLAAQALNISPNALLEENILSPTLNETTTSPFLHSQTSSMF